MHHCHSRKNVISFHRMLGIVDLGKSALRSSLTPGSHLGLPEWVVASHAFYELSSKFSMCTTLMLVETHLLK